jgi:hypothetical protein
MRVQIACAPFKSGCEKSEAGAIKAILALLPHHEFAGRVAG